MQLSYNVNPADAKQGVVAYSVSVVECPITHKQTNLVFRTPSGKLRIAYDQDAANQLDNE